jgi:hypothetical protein
VTFSQWRNPAVVATTVGREEKTRGDLGRRCRWLQPAYWRERRPYIGAALRLHVADEPRRNGRRLPVKRAGACTAEVRGSNPLRSTIQSWQTALVSVFEGTVDTRVTVGERDEGTPSALARAAGARPLYLAAALVAALLSRWRSDTSC